MHACWLYCSASLASSSDWNSAQARRTPWFSGPSRTAVTVPSLEKNTAMDCSNGQVWPVTAEVPAKKAAM